MWNPAALGYLAELILALVLAVAALHGLSRRRPGGPGPSAGLFLALTLCCLAGSIFCSLLRAQLGGFFDTYAMPWAGPTSPQVLIMPWAPVVGGGAIAAFVQFAYRFPGDLPGARRERHLVGLAMLALVAVECAVAARSNLAGLRGEIWFRSERLTLWMGLSVAWAAGVFLRQFKSALGEPGWRSAARRLGERGLPRPASAARAYLVVLLLPLVHILLLVAGRRSLFENVPLDVISCWMVLSLLTALALVQFNHQAEQSGFMLKMVVVSLAVILAVIIAFDWLVDPAFVRDFRPARTVAQGQTLSFTPDGRGGYAVAAAPFAPEDAAGVPVAAADGRLDLPFAFPFYGAPRRTLYVSADGAVGFARRPDWGDIAVGYGRQPAVYPLAMTMTGARVTAADRGDRLVIDWRARCGPHADAPPCRVQLVLHRDGRIAVSYLELPEAFAYRLFEPRAAPWFVGLTSGRDPAPRPVVLMLGATVHGAPGAALIQDDYLAFLRHLDRLYAPLAWLMLAASAVVALALPAFFRLNLLIPLRGLLDGMTRFQRGDFAARAPIVHDDELGYLARAFNEMAAALQTQVTRLEEQVAERVEEVSRFAAKTALLEERGRLAADLHDTVSQNLFSAALLADALSSQLRGGAPGDLETVDQIRALSRQALEELRLLMSDLHAQQLAGSPLSSLLRDLARDFEAAHGLTVERSIRGDAVLPTQVQAVFYRVAQESLSNIARHARATRAALSLESGPERTVLTITDNGRGFDAAATPPGHLGLQIMGYRAKLVGATLRIASRPGAGAVITLTWPAEAPSAPPPASSPPPAR